MKSLLKLAAASASLATAAAATGIPAATAAGGSTLPVMHISRSSVKSAELGGATPLSTDRTVPHWHGQFTDPTNGKTYGYNMVGADPATNSSTTVPTDIYPINVVLAANNGYAFNGTDVVNRTISSPVFQPGDYSSTAHSGDYTTGGQTGGGQLSAGNTGVQYEDAIMRSQFNKVGTGYHLRLGQPTVHDPITLTVPAAKGGAYQSSLGVPYGLVDIGWFSTHIQQYMGSQHLDPTHLPIFLTDNVMLYFGNPTACCVFGFHSASVVRGVGAGASNGQGRQGVQTEAWVTYLKPGTVDDTQGGPDPYLRDIHGLTHEIAEWTDDPFLTNAVNPWLTPTAPQYGCTGLLETGDPVVGIGFTMPGNSYDTGQYADGYWHPEDEVFLPWFARESPNTTSQPTQTPSTRGGRYTFMGDLNPYPGFRQPATGC